MHRVQRLSVTGPFVDRAGRKMLSGGGTLVLANHSGDGRRTMVGPGHAGVLADARGAYAFTFDFQGIAGESGNFLTQARQLSWDAEGWPLVGDGNFAGRL